MCLGLNVGTYGGCVVHVVVGGEWVVLWVAATLYMHRHTYSVQCSDKIRFLQLCIKCGIAKSCPGTHTALQAPMLLTPQPCIPETTLLCPLVTNTRHSWQNGTRCRDGVKVLWCCSYLVWLVFEGSIPTCACFQLKTFLLLFDIAIRGTSSLGLGIHTTVADFEI